MSIKDDRNLSERTSGISSVTSDTNIALVIPLKTTETIVHRNRKRKRKIKNAYNLMVNVIEILLELYNEAELRRSVRSYKYGTRPSILYEHEKTLIYRKKEIKEEKRLEKRNLPTGEWLLEKETISSLKKMMTDPKTLKDVKSVIPEYSKPEKSVTHNYITTCGYLDRFREEDKRDLNKNESLRMQKIYKLGADNIFTPEEMDIIKLKEELFHRERRHSRKFNKTKKKMKSDPELEVREWKDFVNHSFDQSSDKYESSFDLSRPVGETNEQIIQRIKRHLNKWLDREYPLSETLNLQFHFYESICGKHRKRKSETDEKRLQVSIRFLKLAQIAYPDLDVNQILTDLAAYFGNQEIPTIAKREVYSRDQEEETTNETKLSKSTSARTKKFEEKINRKRIKTEKQKVPNKTKILEKMKHLAKLYDLELIYDKFKQARLPTPYDTLYVKIVEGIFKIHEKTAKYGKLHEELIFELSRNLSKSIFDCVEWLIDSLLRSHIWQNTKEYEEERKMPPKQRNPFYEFKKQKKIDYHKVKEAMARVIKYQKLHMIVSNMINENIANLSSSESLSLQEKDKIGGNMCCK